MHNKEQVISLIHNELKRFQLLNELRRGGQYQEIFRPLYVQEIMMLMETPEERRFVFELRYLMYMHESRERIAAQKMELYELAVIYYQQLQELQTKEILH